MSLRGSVTWILSLQLVLIQEGVERCSFDGGSSSLQACFQHLMSCLPSSLLLLFCVYIWRCDPRSSSSVYHACLLPSPFTMMNYQSSGIRSNKFFLLCAALVTVFNHSSRKGTNTLSQKLKISNWFLTQEWSSLSLTQEWSSLSQET